ncbi:MAG: hypothetical protein K1X85_14675 [Ignavibacteria bacterium]|nr:hypothetical protein [Ignavibacteria bacterium]
MISGGRSLFSKIITALLLGAVLYSCSEGDSPTNPSSVEYTQIDFDAAWSSDGRRIAFIHNDLDGELTGLYVMDSSGSNKVQIVQGNVTSPDWSPADTAIAFEAGGSLYVYSLLNNAIRSLVIGPGAVTVRWNHSNGKIAYIQNSKLIVSNSDGSLPLLIDQGCAWPAWANYGDNLYYFKPSTGSGGIQNGDSLFIYFPALNTRQFLLAMSETGYSANTHLSVSGADAYFSRTYADASSYIFDAPNSSSPQKIISSLSYAPDCSRSGRLIYTNRTRGDGRIWIREVNGAERKLIY